MLWACGEDASQEAKDAASGAVQTGDGSAEPSASAAALDAGNSVPESGLQDAAAAPVATETDAAHTEEDAAAGDAGHALDAGTHATDGEAPQADGASADAAADARSDTGDDAGEADAQSLSDAGPSVYDDADKWLCRPGLANSLCDGPKKVTDIHADGTTSVWELPETPKDAAADCFYLYPTVDPGLFGPRNLDFDEIDMAAVRDIARSQIIPFRELCNIYAPVYRQASLSAIDTVETRDQMLGVAYRDVADAFDHFLRDAKPGRPIMLVVHSQGARHTVQLLQERFDGHPELRARLAVAVLAGPMGGFQVPKGERMGGSLKEIPLCSTSDETGCVLTYNSFAKRLPPNAAFGDIYGALAPNVDTGCTAPPGGSGGSAARMRGAVFFVEVNLGFPLSLLAPKYDFGRGVRVATPYARLVDFYTARCLESVGGVQYLEIAAAPQNGDTRVDPVPYDNIAFTDPSVGLHAIDYSFVSGDLVEALRTKLEAHQR